MNFFCFPFLHFGEFSLEEGEGEAVLLVLVLSRGGWLEPLFLQENISLRMRGRESLRRESDPRGGSERENYLVQ